MRSLKRAFTLIELLVVIAIIAILAAILFPVFAAAKEAAKKTGDLSNMKQISTAIQLYLQDSDDVYPFSVFDSYQGTFRPDRPHYLWSSSLCVYPYIKSAEVLVSPPDQFQPFTPAALTAFALPASRPPRPISYMANAITPFYAMFGVAAPQGLMPYAPNLASSNERWGTTNATEVPNPSEMILLANGRKEWETYSAGSTTWLQNELGYIYASNVYEQWWINFIVASPSSPWGKAWRKFPQGTNGGANFVFSDTSAKVLRPGQVRDAKRWIVNAP